MAFKKTRKAGNVAKTPEQLFLDLRNRKIAGLLAHQADLLREYDRNAVDLSDVALQLPTGSGKTLVGLLIAEWRRQRKEKVVFLCPTKQLVNQVVAQGKNYGIKTIPFTGPKRDYKPASKTAYLTGAKVAVATYSALFNTNPFFDEAETLIFDDAHAAENYVAKFWSLSIDSKTEPNLFETLRSVFESSLGSTFKAPPPGAPANLDWVEKLPSRKLRELGEAITSVVDAHTQNGSELF